MSDTYYRFEDHGGYIECIKYDLIKKTPKGAWIRRTLPWHGTQVNQKRFVLDGEGKRLAYPTKELARTSFIARKRRQVAILQSRLEVAKEALRHASATPADKLENKYCSFFYED